MKIACLFGPSGLRQKTTIYVLLQAPNSDANSGHIYTKITKKGYAPLLLSREHQTRRGGCFELMAVSIKSTRKYPLILFAYKFVLVVILLACKVVS